MRLSPSASIMPISRESRDRPISSRLALSTQVSGRVGSATASVSRPGATLPNTQVNGEKIVPMAREDLSMSTVTFMMATGLMTRQMAVVCTST